LAFQHKKIVGFIFILKIAILDTQVWNTCLKFLALLG